MNMLDFTLELNSDTLNADEEMALFTEADERLRALAEGHDDLVGAAINVRQPAKNPDTPFIYEVTVVAYTRPENTAATKKEEDPLTALKESLSAVERQVRQTREKLRARWEQPGNSPVEQEITELVAAETEEPLDDDLFEV